MEFNTTSMMKPQSTSMQQQKSNPMANIGGANLNMFLLEKKGSAAFTNETMKNGNKRSYDENEESVIKNDPRKKVKKENNTNNLLTAKKEKFVLSKNDNITAFQEAFSSILKEYPDILKANIEKTLNELKSEGYIVNNLKNLLIFKIFM